MAKQRQQLLKDKPIGTAWKEIVEEILLKDGLERARELAATDTATGRYDVVVRTPITFFVRFPRDGQTVADAGQVDCACIIEPDVCICYGPCLDFPECCDEGPILKKG